MKKTDKEKEKRPKQVINPSRFFFFLSVLCFLVVFVHMAASFFTRGRIWGINQWAYFPLWASIGVGVLGLSVFIPSVNASLRRVIGSILSSLSRVFHTREAKDSRSKLFSYFLFSLPFFFLFWWMRDRTHLLGDGAQIISQMNSGQLSIKWAEPLEILVHLRIFNLIRSFWQIDAGTFYALFSCLVGIIFVFSVLVLAKFWGEQRKERVLVFLTLLSLGGIQLFFGYAEHYSLSYLLVFLFILSSLGYLERRVGWFLPLLIFVLAASAHFSNLCLLPALLLLFFPAEANHRRMLSRKILIGSAGVLGLGLILVFYLKFGWTKPPILVPILQDRYAAPGYLLFSLPHLLDFLNQQFLVSPVGLTMISALFFGGVWTFFGKSRIFQFLLVLTLSQLFLNFVVDPGLGAARDWDMFSSVGLGCAFLGLYLFLQLFRREVSFGYLGFILIVVSFYSTVPWVALNASPSKSITRFQNLLDLDPKRSTNGHFVLIKYFEAHGMKEEAKQENARYGQAFPEVVLLDQASQLVKQGELEKAEQLLGQAEGYAPLMPQIHDLLGRIYLQRKELGRAEEELKKAIRLASFLSDPYVNLADVYLSRQQYDLALETSQKAIQLKSEYPQTYSNIGSIYFLKGDINQAESYYLKALELNPKFTDAYVDLGDLYSRKGMLDQALKMYQTALGMNPEMTKLHFRLGVVYYSIDSPQRAKEELELYLKDFPEGKDAQKAREILSNLKQ
jgi:type IV pilus assembly protein PilF